MLKLIGNLLALNGALLSKAKSVTVYNEALGYYEAKEYERAHPLILEAAELGNIDAIVMLGTNFLMGTGVQENGKEAERWLKIAVEAGHEGAISVLGMGYATGKGGFPRNLDLGVELLERAVGLGDERSAEMLEMIRKGKGIFAKKLKR